MDFIADSRYVPIALTLLAETYAQQPHDHELLWEEAKSKQES